MTTQTQTICDRCAAATCADRDTLDVEGWRAVNVMSDIPGASYYRDLCPYCAKKLADFFDGEPVT